MTLKEQIVPLLSERFKGERKDGLALLAGTIALQAKSLEEAQSLIDNLGADEVKSFIKDYRSEVDRETTEAIRKAKANIEPKPKKEGEDPQGEGINTENNLAELIQQAVSKELQPLQAKIKDFEAEKQAGNRLALVQEALKNCKDEHFAQSTLKNYQRMHFADDDAFGSFVTELKADVDGANQRIADQGLGGLPKPFIPQGGDGKVSKEVLDSILPD